MSLDAAIADALTDCDKKDAVHRIIQGKPDRFIPIFKGKRLKRIHYGDPRYEDAPFEESITAYREP